MVEGWVKKEMKRHTRRAKPENEDKVIDVLDLQIEDAEKKRVEIDKLIDNFLERSDFTKEALEKILSNPDNFTPAQWERFQSRIAKMEKDAERASGIKNLKQKEEKKKLESKAAKTKGKSLGSRKKWLPMK